MIYPESLKEQVETGLINDPLRNSVHNYGFLYHPYQQICMGRCSMCRDHARDQNHVRKIKKYEFRNLIQLELAGDPEPEERIHDEIAQREKYLRSIGAIPYIVGVGEE